MSRSSAAPTSTAAIEVQPRYRATDRRWVTSNPDTTAAIAALLEHSGGRHATPLVRRRGGPLPPAREIITEDGASIAPASRVPRSLPDGYHRLIDADGAERMLVVTPGRCHLPETGRQFGLATQLYSVRSEQSWGMGDLADLRHLAHWAHSEGAQFLLLNPLHAALPLDHQEPCPYYPSSRQYRNPLYLSIDEIPGAAALGDRLEGLRRAGHALNASATLDRDPIWQLKREALETIWASQPPCGGLSEFVDECGASLERYARFCALTEAHGPGWRSWPEPLRRCDSAEVTAWAQAHPDRVRFHMWLQWLTAEQLARAAGDITVMNDLAIGCNPDGADCWSWGGAYAGGYTTGAPPDRFNTMGQNWATPPFNPLALRELNYQPFIEMVRAAMRGGGALRFDHVMGLFRLWWVPENGSAADGAYVRYPSADLLGILALESSRARALVVGEDLGTVEAGARPALHRAGVLSFRLLIFAGQTPPERFPREAMTAVTTHDLPTVAGLWTGSDLRDQQRLQLQPNVSATERSRRDLIRLTGGDPALPVDQAVVSVHRALARSPSRLLVASLEDLAVSPIRPNMPGTTSPTWPDWEVPLPLTLEQLTRSPVAASITAALRADAVSTPTPAPN